VQVHVAAAPAAAVVVQVDVHHSRRLVRQAQAKQQEVLKLLRSQVQTAVVARRAVVRDQQLQQPHKHHPHNNSNSNNRLVSHDTC
jgi:hypothetical protein